LESIEITINVEVEIVLKYCSKLKVILSKEVTKSQNGYKEDSKQVVSYPSEIKSLKNEVKEIKILLHQKNTKCC